jgi:alpha-tubulin suppressor-like RCC1 family protein
VTAAEATSVNFYSDGVLLGNVSGPSPISIYARPYPGVHHITYDVFWSNGSLTGRDAANRNYFPIRVSSQGNAYTCAVQNGSAWCWGSNASGQMGIGVSGGYYSTRQAVSGMSSGVSDIATGPGSVAGTACAVKDGGVKCWGDNSNNILQNGTGVESNVPVQVIPANSGIVQVGVGWRYACALSNTGAVQCWGFGSWGQMGNGTWTANSGRVTPTGMGSGVQSLSVGTDSACVIQSSTVKCWGANGYGQIGNNSNTNVNVPTSTGYSFGTSLISVSVGQHLACVTGVNQSVWCWGRNDQDGTGTPGQPTYKTPMLVPLTGAVGTIVGAQVVCAGIAPPVSSTYTPVCWGANDLGQLGQGFVSDHEDPPEPPINVPWTFAGSASNTVCVVTDGHLKCWGQNSYGQVGAGAGAPDPVVTPTLVTGF